MATSTLRAAIIVAAVLLGAVVLANAFPGSVNSGPSTQPTTIGPTTTGSPTSPASPPTVDIEGVELQVLNGTTTDNLARNTADCLITAGAVVPDDNIGQPPEDYAKTTLIHVPGAKPIAEELRRRFFHGAVIQQDQVIETLPNVKVTVPTPASPPGGRNVTS
jgi:LytR cell envelope-related transcriptional attenuator